MISITFLMSYQENKYLFYKVGYVVFQLV